MTRFLDKQRSSLKNRFHLSKIQIICIIIAVVLAVVFMTLLFYKDDCQIADCSVSLDEQYVVFVKRADRWKNDYEVQLVCCNIDGQQLFEKDITDHTAGGTCAVWFEDKTIVVYFFRNHLCISYSMSGEVLEEYTYTENWSPKLFREFKSIWGNRKYTASDFVLTYKNAGFISYYMMKKPRSLILTKSDGSTYTFWIAYAQSE